jgi:hypothetical protein
MSEVQRGLAHDLLRTGLSARGYNKVTSIIQLEDVLKVMEAGGKFARNKKEYLFSVFGTPGPKGPWGWRVEGHHVSIRFTINDGSVTNQVGSKANLVGSKANLIASSPLHSVWRDFNGDFGRDLLREHLAAVAH